MRMSGTRTIALAIGALAIVGLPLAGVAFLRAFNAFLWIALLSGACALYVLLGGFRRQSALLVPLMILAPGAPVALWLAIEPGLSGVTNWRALLLVIASGTAGWIFAHLSPAIALWRADMQTRNAVRHARENIEKLVADWGPQIARPYAPRPALPARVKNLK